MRYFVYLEPLSDLARPYILAEVTRDTEDDGRFREWSAAAALAGASARVLLREELMETANGRDALRAWDAHDDHEFDSDSERMANPIQHEGEAIPSVGRHLRLVT